MKLKSFLPAVFCLLILEFSLSAEDSSKILKDTLSDFNFSAEYLIDYPDDNMNDYCKNTFGLGLGFEKNILKGLFSSTEIFFQGHFLLKEFTGRNLEFISLENYCFLSGLLFSWELPQKLFLYLGTEAGFSISDVEYISFDNGKIDDVYYDFCMKNSLGFRKKLYETKACNIFYNAALNFTFQNEKSKSFCMLGPSFGLVFSFSPLSSD